MLSVMPCCCTVRAKFTGCGNLALANYGIDLYDHSGGTLLQSVTTDASGFATFAYPGPAWAQSSDGRFSGDAFAVPPYIIPLTTLAAGYACRDHCAIPVSKTTYFTDVNGTWTLVYDGVGWSGCGVSGPLPTTVTGLDIHCRETTGPGTLVYSIAVGVGNGVRITWVIVPSTFFPGASVSVSSFASPLPGGSDPACIAGVLGWTEPPPCIGASTEVSGGANAGIVCPPAFANHGTIGSIGLVTNPNPGPWVETE